MIRVVSGFEQECLDAGLQLFEVPVVELEHGPPECDPAVFAGFLGAGGGVYIRPGCLQHSAEEHGYLGRAGVVTGWFVWSWSVHPLDLAARESTVISDLDELALFELGEMMVEAVWAHGDLLGKLFCRLGLADEQLVKAHPQRVGQGSMHRTQSRWPVVAHVPTPVGLFSTDMLPDPMNVGSGSHGILGVFAAASTTSSAESITTEIVSAAVLAYVLYNQRRVRPLQTKLLLPAALIVAGLSNLSSDINRHPLSTDQSLILIGLFLGDAIGLGAIRAYTVRLWPHGEQLVRQGSWSTVGLWLTGVAIHEATLAAAHVDSSSLLLYMGLTLSAQRLTLAVRARHPDELSKHQPQQPPPRPRAT